MSADPEPLGSLLRRQPRELGLERMIRREKHLLATQNGPVAIVTSGATSGYVTAMHDTKNAVTTNESAA